MIRRLFTAYSLDRSTNPGLVFLLCLLFSLAARSATAEPRATKDGVMFLFDAAGASTVSVAGEFNSWSPTANPMKKNSGGLWATTLSLSPGTYRYKFVVNGNEWKQDPNNPAGVDDNYGGLNSIFILRADGGVLMAEEDGSATPSPPSDEYPKKGGTLYLNIIWHQHQPLYLDPSKDELRGPWVRTHGTKDYYDMAAILTDYPDVHVNVNLTSSLLLQLQKYYVDRLGPYYDATRNRIDAARYLAEMGGHTDPWIDLALRPTSSFGDAERALLYGNAWNAFGISDVMIARFPEYLALRNKPHASFSTDDLLALKAWFFLAYFDPDFLRVPVDLATGLRVDLTDLITEDPDGLFHLKRPFTEDDANRLVAEAWKVMAAVVPVHRKLMFDPDRGTGQIEVMTTPFYHPILPLLMDTDLARQAMPGAALPNRFSHPEDAEAQVAKAVAFYSKTFGRPPRGMWPGEGSVAEAIVPILVKNGITWMASADGVLKRSTPGDLPVYQPYRVDADHTAGGNTDEAMAIVFRDTPLSDKIGFRYQSIKPEEAADDFIRSVLAYAPDNEREPRLLTVILDGENAWEWYRRDNDARQFLNAVYRKLSKLYESRQVVTVTTSEFLVGNAARGVSPHPVSGLAELEPLWAGSWINANFDTWIGESEENAAWNLLGDVREDLEMSGLKAPDPGSPVPDHPASAEDYRILAWEEMYAAEGSDWFWWYGNDQNAPGGDEPFDEAFLFHLRSVYDFGERAGVVMTRHPLMAIMAGNRGRETGTPATGGGTMAPGAAGGAVQVVFVCNPEGRAVSKALYIVGDKDELGQWTPNKIPLYDDGTHGDEKSGDGIWSISFQWPAGTSVKYKYTNSGEVGVWSPGEEFPVADRSIAVRDEGSGRMIIRDTFGVIQ